MGLRPCQCGAGADAPGIKDIDITGIPGMIDAMSITSPEARALAALGHDARLSIFRLLVQAGDDGLRVGDLGRLLGLAPSTLSHHLSTLVDAQLVLQDRRGREVFNRADYPAMHGILRFLTAKCCTGVRIDQDETAA